MNITKTLYVKDRKQWRSWLEKYHESEKEVRLLYYKKHTGKPRIPYNGTVEEALCYGWIDSTVKKTDEDRFAQRFTPRKAGSPWSEMNKERVRRLMNQGKMTPAGLAKVGGFLGFPGRSSKKGQTEKRSLRDFSRHSKTVEAKHTDMGAFSEVS